MRRNKAPPNILKTRKGEHDIAPGFLTLLEPEEPKIEPLPNSTGRRTVLANWITRPDNQLATRVITNRVWHYHFGRGIVATPNDFGDLGEEPDASRVARLAHAALPRRRLEPEEAAPRDPALRDLSPDRASHAAGGRGEDRPDEQIPLALQSAPARRRAGARRDARRQRRTRSQGRRPIRRRQRHAPLDLHDARSATARTNSSARSTRPPASPAPPSGRAPRRRRRRCCS